MELKKWLRLRVNTHDKGYTQDLALRSPQSSALKFMETIAITLDGWSAQPFPYCMREMPDFREHSIDDLALRLRKAFGFLEKHTNVYEYLKATKSAIRFIMVVDDIYELAAVLHSPLRKVLPSEYSRYVFPLRQVSVP